MTLPREPRTTKTFTKKERLVAMERFLESFSQTAIIVVACEAAGVSRTLVRWWIEHDCEGFAARYNQAKEDANDYIRAEIHRRAITGVDKPVYQGGKKVGTIREYSDGLLQFLAKSRMPEFREQIDINIVRQETERLARERGLSEEEVALAVREAEMIARGRGG